jgi:hypothetical protein
MHPFSTNSPQVELIKMVKMLITLHDLDTRKPFREKLPFENIKAPNLHLYANSLIGSHHANRHYQLISQQSLGVITIQTNCRRPAICKRAFDWCSVQKVSAAAVGGGGGLVANQRESLRSIHRCTTRDTFLFVFNPGRVCCESRGANGTAIIGSGARPVCYFDWHTPPQLEIESRRHYSVKISTLSSSIGSGMARRRRCFFAWLAN